VAAGCMVAWPVGATNFSASEARPKRSWFDAVVDDGYGILATTIASWLIDPWLGAVCAFVWVVLQGRYDQWKRRRTQLAGRKAASQL